MTIRIGIFGEDNVRLELSGDVVATQSRHHDVEDQEIGTVQPAEPQRLLTVERAKAEKARIPERHVQEVRNGVVVLGNYDLFQQA